MKDILRNLFKKESTVTSFVIVKTRISASRYEVEDHAGRLQVGSVVSSAYYPNGTRVVVQNGRIIGTGRRAGGHRIYEV